MKCVLDRSGRLTCRRSRRRRSDVLGIWLVVVVELLEELGGVLDDRVVLAALLASVKAMRATLVV